MAQFDEHDSHRCGDRAARRQRRSALQDRHDLADPASARLRARGRADRAEWMTAIRFLTAVGQTCTDKRQEFILLSDTLGVSILVDAINHRTPGGAVESTVLGPWYVGGRAGAAARLRHRERRRGRARLLFRAPADSGRRADRGRHARRLVGRRRGRLRHADARPGRRCCAAASFRTDAEGRYWFRSIRPIYYPVPTDGPVGDMLRKMGRQPNRPGHIHMIVSAPGYETVGDPPVRRGRAVSRFRSRCSRSRIR